MSNLAIERLQTAVDAAGVGTWDFNPITGELVWSERCKEIFGLPTGADVTFAIFLEGLHPDDRATTQAAIGQALDPAGPGSYAIEYRTRWNEPAALPHWAFATGRAFFDEGRTQAVRFIGTITDVTERKELQERLLQAYEDTEVKVQFRSLELEREVQRLRAQLAEKA